MHYPTQLIRLTKFAGGGNLWINPDHIIYAEQGEKKMEKGAPPGKPEFMSILHMTGKEGKLFVKESPEEINKILRSIKQETKVETTTSFK